MVHILLIVVSLKKAILTFTHLEGDSKQAELIICIDVIAQEAKVLGILYEEQLAHIFIHGILHAYGYDHDAPQEAEIMQAKESILMQDLGFTDPWSDTAC